MPCFLLKGIKPGWREVSVSCNPLIDSQLRHQALVGCWTETDSSPIRWARVAAPRCGRQKEEGRSPNLVAGAARGQGTLATAKSSRRRTPGRFQTGSK